MCKVIQTVFRILYTFKFDSLDLIEQKVMPGRKKR